MARALRDSYTGEVVSEYYTSRISGINEPRGLYKEQTFGSSASYRADKQDDGTFAIGRCPQIARELPGYPLCSVADEVWANRILDWFVANDHIMLRAIEHLADNFEPFFNCIERAMQETITA